MAGFGVRGGQPVKANARLSKLSNADRSGSDPSGSMSGFDPFSDLLAAGSAAPDVSFAGSWMSRYGFAENHTSIADNGSSDTGVSGRGFSNRSGGSASVSDLISGAGAASTIFFAGKLRLGSILARKKLLLEGKKLWLHFVAVTLQRLSPVLREHRWTHKRGLICLLKPSSYSTNVRDKRKCTRLEFLIYVWILLEDSECLFTYLPGRRVHCVEGKPLPAAD